MFRRGALADAREQHLAHSLVVGRVGVGRSRVRVQPLKGVEEPARPVEDHPEMAPLAGPAGRRGREKDRGRGRDLGERGSEVQGLQNDRRGRKAEGRREGAQIQPDAFVALRGRAVDGPIEELVCPEARRPWRARSALARTTRPRPEGIERAASSANSGVTPAIASRPRASPAVVMYPASRTVDTSVMRRTMSRVSKSAFSAARSPSPHRAIPRSPRRRLETTRRAFGAAGMGEAGKRETETGSERAATGGPAPTKDRTNPTPIPKLVRARARRARLEPTPLGRGCGRRARATGDRRQASGERQARACESRESRQSRRSSGMALATKADLSEAGRPWRLDRVLLGRRFIPSYRNRARMLAAVGDAVRRLFFGAGGKDSSAS